MHKKTTLGNLNLLQRTRHRSKAAGVRPGACSLVTATWIELVACVTFGTSLRSFREIVTFGGRYCKRKEMSIE